MRRILAGLTVTVVAGALAGPARPAAAAAPAAAPAGAHSVTLITGDRVVVLDRPDGTRAVTVTPGPGRAHIQYLRPAGTDRDGRDRLQVIPVDAIPLLSAGRLDPRLFDVTGLIRQGYDDRSRPDLPLLVGYRPGVAAARSIGG